MIYFHLQFVYCTGQFFSTFERTGEHFGSRFDNSPRFTVNLSSYKLTPPHTERDRQTDRERDRDRQTNRDRERQRETREGG